ncbi:hypothetical protein [Bradyrhizobium sp. BRP22]|uniref:hypothetical protein n=1 Tax=Bradyrhizobium sp. BRP22 TaxID=2793821 RepID=UPI001CD47742|nr:hypothetical protein [Bradyrhizobium sp. BRP22]
MLVSLPAQIINYVLRTMVGEKFAGFVRNVSVLAQPFDFVALCICHGIVLGIQGHGVLPLWPLNVLALELFLTVDCRRDPYRTSIWNQSRPTRLVFLKCRLASTLIAIMADHGFQDCIDERHERSEPTSGLWHGHWRSLACWD